MKGLEGYGKVNRLAVVLVQETENKLLCIAKMEQSTGSVEAEKIKEVLVEWGVAEKIIACGFDTTSSNTGVNKGCCVILQTLLNRQILWLACRHHIPELIIGAAFTTLFGDTKSPEATLFKVLKDCWDTLDLDYIHLPNIPAFYRNDKDDLLSFINSKLQDADHLPRCDYKEYLELAKLILGDKITRKNGFIFHLSRPGADHHARWMSKAIYAQKMVLLQHQLPDLHWQTKKKMEKMALFVVFVYLRPWFTASGLSSAAQNDLLFCKSLAKYKKINNGVSSKTLAVLNRHTWYLTEYLISLSLFNEYLSLETRTLLAAQIHQESSPADIDIRKPTLPAVTINSELLDFFGPRSKLLFDLLEIPTDFLITAEWTQSTEYETAKQALKSLSTTNDSAERAIALAFNYNTKITRDEESYQELLQVVGYHRNTFGYRTKKDLKTFYWLCYYSTFIF